MNNLVKCKKCKWVHFEAEEPNVHPEYKYEPPRNCFRCGNDYTDFEDALKEDLPNGSTIQPILKRSLK
jgi:hypothetical protein